MNKIKAVRKGGMSFIVIKSQNGQQLNTREIEAIAKKEILNLLNLELKNNGSKFVISYNVTGYISLATYLKSPLSKECFALLLENIYSALNSMQTACFNSRAILMDFNHIMINPATKTLSFIYIPIQYYDNGISLKEFLLKIAFTAIFLNSEDITYVKEYINILNNGANFSAYELEQYICKLKNIESSETSITCSKCNTSAQKLQNFCHICGSSLKGKTSTGNITYNPLHGHTHSGSNDKSVNFKPSSSTKNFSETTVLGVTEKQGDDTTVLCAEDNNERKTAYLIRQSNNEKIIINKPSFRLGKEKSYCDYFVSDNSAVSRSHADILTKDGRYFIIDNNSTNKSYIDDIVISINTEIEIFHGTQIRLANENFAFLVE